ncbi:MAG: hypothetical protein AAB464_00635 [Patescibacteria group bacterium]
MRKFFIFLTVILIIGGAIYYIYSAFDMVKAYTFTIPNLNLADKIASVKDFISAKEKESVKNLNAQGEFLIDKTSKSVKERIFLGIKESANEAIDSLGESFGVELDNQKENQNQECYPITN